MRKRDAHPLTLKASLIFLLFLSSPNLLALTLKDLLPYGVQLKFGSFFTNHSIELGEESTLDENTNAGSPLFPMIPVWKENLITDHSFGKLFFDFELPVQSFNLTPSQVARSSLRSNWLSSAEVAFTNTHPNWALSADLKSWSLALGYEFGLFMGDQTKRWFKASLGFLSGYLYYKVRFHLCSSYIDDSDQISLTNKSSGTCLNKTFVDEIRHTGPGFGLTFSFTFFERKWHNGFVEIFTLNVARMEELFKKEVENRPTDLEVNFSTTFSSLQLVGFTFLF